MPEMLKGETTMLDLDFWFHFYADCLANQVRKLKPFTPVDQVIYRNLEVDVQDGERAWGERVTFFFDARNPSVIRMQFNRPRGALPEPWTFSRTLLAAGFDLLHPDQAFDYEGFTVVYMSEWRSRVTIVREFTGKGSNKQGFSANCSTVKILASRRGLKDFLGKTYRLVPVQHEADAFDPGALLTNTLPDS
jgi:hypothetical protein